MNRKKTVIVSATSDLATDQRVHKICLELLQAGFYVICVGRQLKTSPPLHRDYRTVRFRLPAESGILFYASYQVWLFFFLLFMRAEGLWSNDLDTLLPNWVISKVKRIPLAYDSHEYFCGSPEVLYRPSRFKVWKTLENILLPRLKCMLTVNESIAELYSYEYGIEVQYVRNISPLPADIPNIDRKSLGFHASDFIIIVQGRGLNVDRGTEELLEALLLLPQDIKVLIIGSGNALSAILKKIHSLDLSSRVKYLPPMPYNQMLGYTKIADAGASLDKINAPNYKYSLPNKVFDFIHCKIPVISSQAIEVKKIVEYYRIGEIIKSHSPEDIAEAIRTVMRKGKSSYAKGLDAAAQQLTWEKESIKLRSYIEKCFSTR
ncbi:MAG: glycosyltransferase [Thermaurantimonas sp.]